MQVRSFLSLEVSLHSIDVHCSFIILSKHLLKSCSATKKTSHLRPSLQKTLASETVLPCGESWSLLPFFKNQYLNKFFCLYSLFPFEGVKFIRQQDIIEGVSSSDILASLV